MRLIDADALGVLSIIGGRMYGKVEFAKAVNKMIQNAPTIDAVPVRHGGMIIMLIGFTVAVAGFVLVIGSLVWEEIK